MRGMSTEKELLVSIQEAAARLSISPRSVRYFIRSKALRARKIGRRTVIPVRSLEAFSRSDHESPKKKAKEETEATSSR